MRQTCSATSALAQHQQSLNEVPIVLLIGDSCSPGVTGKVEQSSRLPNTTKYSHTQDTVDKKRQPAVQALEQ